MVKSLLQSAINKVWHATHPQSAVIPSVSIDALDPFTQGAADITFLDGDKFLGGFGATELQIVDYWTLRARSAQLFNENLYARGLIRRLVTNEINVGLSPEAFPDEDIIGVPEESLADWTETVENRFAIWGKNPKMCDWRQSETFWALQRAARAEALIGGDVLIVIRQSRRTGLPTVQLVNGSKVQTPLGGDSNIRKGHKIEHGVEMNALGRVVAHWIRQDDGTTKRIPAFGEKSGRRISWLVYGTDKRHDDVRGQPLLSLILQSLKEIDRYRDSVQRKAVINSILAMFIKKTEDKLGSLPVTGGAVRKDVVSVTDSDGTSRTRTIAGQIPGVVMEELQVGEEPVGFGSQGIDLNFGVFEEAIIQAIAWANEIPPEILRLAFSNNYSASQAAINEFKIYLNKVWGNWGDTFLTPIYVEWLISETLQNRIQATGLLDAWRDPLQYDVFGAWIQVEWYGVIKPSTDMLKQVKGSKGLIEEGWSTNAKESRNLTGTKFSKNIKRLKRENEQKAEMMRPILELQAEFGNTEDTETITALDDTVEAIEELANG